MALAVSGCALVLAASAHAVPLDTRKWMPFFNMGVSQGAYLPGSGGDFFTGANLNASLGLLGRLQEKKSLLGIYNLRFGGEGFRFPDTQEFSSKDLSHNFTMEYRWQKRDNLRIRPGIAYSIDYSRTAAGEIWGKGLYDNRGLGFQIAFDRYFKKKDKEGVWTFQWLWRDINFPNYSDIIREFQGLSSNVELAGGLKDQRLNDLSLAFHWDRISAKARLNFQSFQSEKVVEANGTYGNTPQKDSGFNFNLGYDTHLGKFAFTPAFGITAHGSNQNFLLFKSPTDPSPDFTANYYDFTEVELNFPFSVQLGKKWWWNLGLDWRHRAYSERQPRDEGNNFVGGTQKNNMTVFNTGLRKRINDISAWSLTYTYTSASSNNKFEKYLPYNYSGQGLSLGYQLTY